MFWGEPLQLLPHRDRIKVNQPTGNKLAHWLGMRYAVDMLPNRVNRLLQIGFGDGLLMPELDTRANQLYGFDDHEFNDDVQDRLRLNGVHVQLLRGSWETLPYLDHYFDRIVLIGGVGKCIDWENAILEMARVLSPVGRLVIALYGKSTLTEQSLLRSFELLRVHRFPRFFPPRFSLVSVLELQPLAVTYTPHSKSSVRQSVAV